MLDACAPVNQRRLCSGRLRDCSGLLECDESLSVGCLLGPKRSVGFMTKDAPFLIVISTIEYRIFRRNRYLQLEATRAKVGEEMPLL